MSKKVLVWINCYGHWQPEDRDPLETIGYNQYLASFVESVVSLKNRIDRIYISGGMLNSKGLTECETVEPELTRRLKTLGLTIQIVRDEESLTTISIARRFVETAKEKISNCTPLLFCDEVRYQTNLYLVAYFAKKVNFSISPKQVVVPLARLDNHPDSSLATQKEKIERMQREGVEVVESEEINKRRKIRL